MAEKADITMEEARALVANTALWPRIRDFLWDFAPQIHRSWIEGLEFLESLEGLDNLDRPSILGRPRVKRFVLSSLGVEPCFHAFPKGDWSRLLLLDGDTLVAIAKWLGALVCADDLRRVMDGKAVRELKADLAGVYPEVFMYTAYFKEWKSGKVEEWKSGKVEKWKSGKAEERKMSDVVAEIGCEMLFSAVSELPDCLVRRLALRLPNFQASPATPPSRGSDLPQFNFSASLPRLLKLKFPEAYSLCC